SATRVDGIDYVAGGQLALETDGQYCCRWVVPLSVVALDAEPLFPTPQTLTIDHDDPPVSLVDPEELDPVARIYAERFSTYVLTTVWDSAMWTAGVYADFDRLLPAHALD